MLYYDCLALQFLSCFRTNVPVIMGEPQAQAQRNQPPNLYGSFA